MRLAEGYELRSLGSDHLVFAPAGRGSRRAIRLNGSAAFLWARVKGRDFEVEDLAALLVDEYGIEPSRAEADARSIAAAWLAAGLAILSP